MVNDGQPRKLVSRPDARNKAARLAAARPKAARRREGKRGEGLSDHASFLSVGRRKEGGGAFVP